MVKIGGFDTHASQVESYDPTMGIHAALMYHISTAMKAFQDDLKARGLEDRVLTVTTSEFGRRVHSNGSYGTDHGTGGPIFVFGRGVKPGVVGKVPDMTRDNIEMQYDYRQVYANLLKDWMLVDEEKINNDIFFGNFINGPKEDGGNYEPLPLATQVITGIESFVNQRFRLDNCHPNPAKNQTAFSFMINAEGLVRIVMYDQTGKAVKTLVNKTYEPGEHQVKVDLTGVPPGLYIYKLNIGSFEQAKKLIVTQ